MRARNEDGSTVAEYAGVLLLVGALVLALLAVPGIAEFVREGVARALCLLAGEDCPAAQRWEPAGPCTTASRGGSGDLSLSVLFVELGRGGGFVIEELSDGRVAVTWFDEGELGASLAAEAGARVAAGEQAAGIEAQAEVSAAVRAQRGERKVFPTPQEAEQHLRERILDAGISSLPVGVEQAAGGLRAIVDGITGHERATPDESSTYGEIGIVGKGEARAGAVVVGGQIDSAVAGAVRSVVHQDGSRSVTVMLEADAAAVAGIPLFAEIGGEGQAGVSVQLHLAADGTPVAMTVSHEVAAGSRAVLGTGDGVARGVADELRASMEGHANRRAVVDVHVDLRDPAVREAALGFLAAAPRPQQPVGNPGAFLAAGDALARHVRENAKVSMRVYEDVEREYGAEARVRVGVGAGVEGAITTSESRLVDARYLDRSNGRFVPWTNCLAAAGVG